MQRAAMPDVKLTLVAEKGILNEESALAELRTLAGSSGSPVRKILGNIRGLVKS